jgi:23S rRNA (uracil1939-C5)-methyltransferase
VVKKSETVEVECRSLGCAGEGVCSADGLTLFVPGALPGERLLAEVEEVRPRFAKASLLSVIRPSPHRITPPCPIFDRCGGCQIQHLDYSGQLEAKRQRVIDALNRIGGLRDVEVLPCRPAPTPFGYRNKIQMAIRKEHGVTQVGFYSRNSHELVAVEQCPIHCPPGEAVYRAIRPTLLKSSVEPYCEQTGEGVLRFLLVRSSLSTQETVVTLVTTGRDPKGVEKLGKELMRQHPGVRGVAESINRSRGNAILGNQFRTLVGEINLTETVCGKQFQLSPAAFFQVNPPQAEALYQRAIEWADLQKDQTLLDAYCGVGTLAIIAAGRVAKVIGVEVVESAIENAKENATLNGVTNALFFAGTTEKVVRQLPSFDSVLLNPPRKGCHPEVISALIERNPRRIVYLSCDPATLARDLAILSKSGYCVEAVEPFDMFPQTMHVESVARICR